MVRALAIVVALGACSSKPADDGPLEAKAIGSTGAIVEAPRAWEVSGGGAGGYRVGKGAGRQVLIDEVAEAPRSANELYAKECARAAGAGTREEIPARGWMFVQCNLPGTSGDGKSLIVVHVAAVVKVGERAVKCHFGTPRDPTELIAVCRSLRAR